MVLHDSKTDNSTLDDTSEEDVQHVALVPRFIIDREELKLMQNRNFAIRQIKHKVQNNILTKHWKSRALNQFKRQFNKLNIISELLVKGECNSSPVVVTFPFLIEVLHKVHTQLAHIGRHKLMACVQEHFWHPAMEKVARDICASCGHCQLFKVNNQPIAPPTIKIATSHPFDLLAVDLLQFNKSSKGNIAALVTIDHFSKWLSIVPLHDKRSITVANALKYRILPYLPRIPDRILSDNGPEFIGSDFVDVLKDYNIKHIHSTPYSPASNGAVERVNKTITEMLKGLVSNQNQWDTFMPKAVITYNNTIHSQIGISPSQCILMKAHNTKNVIPLDADSIKNWREGHPNFSSFRINQKVIKKINKTGHQLKYKLGQKFEGPYIVKKIQSNKVSYAITKENAPHKKLIKAHHKQLRAWNDVPQYLIKYLTSADIETSSSSSESISEQVYNVGQNSGMLSESSNIIESNDDNDIIEASSVNADYHSSLSDKSPEILVKSGHRK